MRDLIPEGVFTAVQEQFRESKPVTPADYVSGRREEDSITGAMMKGLRESVRGEVGGYRWETDVVKFRGRGPGALEKRTGADVLIEVRVQDEHGTEVGQKAVLGQAKRGWTSRDKDLLKQIADMDRAAGGAPSIVIDYSEDGANACVSTDVTTADGRPNDLQEGQRKPIGELLGDVFLECKVGRRGMSYDDKGERIVFSDGDSVKRVPLLATFRARTTILPIHAPMVSKRFVIGQEVETDRGPGIVVGVVEWDVERCILAVAVPGWMWPIVWIPSDYVTALP